MALSQTSPATSFQTLIGDLARLPASRDDAEDAPGILEGQARAQRGARPRGDAGVAQGRLARGACVAARNQAGFFPVHPTDSGLA